MIELKAGTHRKAKWVIRHYREIAEAVSHIEKRRPKLVSRIRIDEDGSPLPYELQDLPQRAADWHIVETYVEGKWIMDVIDTVLSERLRNSDAAIMSDVCLRGMSVTDAAAKHGVSEKTVKRSRIRMRAAYMEELAFNNPIEYGSVKP